MFFNKYLRKHYKKYGILYIFGIASLIITDLVEIELPGIISLILEDELALDYVFSIIQRVLGLIIVVAICRILWRILIIGNSIRIEKEMKDDMFSHQQSLSQSYFVKQKIGEMMSLYLSDLKTVQFTMGFGIVMMVDAFFLAIMTLIRIYSINPVLATATIIPMIITTSIGIIASPFISKAYEKQQEAKEHLSQFAQENFSGSSVIRAFAMEKDEISRLDIYNKEVYDTAMKFTKVIAFIETIIETVIQLCVLTIIVVGAILVYNNIAKVDVVVQIFLYFGLLIWPMIAFAQLIDNYSQGKASMKRISVLLDTKNDLIEKEDAIKPIIKGNIVFNHLSFAYPDNLNNKILDDLSFSISAGELVGIIGKTGCGKSTIVELLLRTYNLNPNELLFDGYDIMDINISHLREAIGYVPQNNFLYSDTIFNNIAFGLSNATRAQVEEAAIAANIYDNIMEFPNKFETMVGERGTTLSGGQKQRISIARALIKDPKILILDDSVSAVDTETESYIFKNLRTVRKNKTTIIVSHRITTMQNVDKIVLLDHGRLVGFDTHENLLRDSELYRQLNKEQSLEEYNE